MLNYHEILRLTSLGYNQTQIHVSTGHSRVSIQKVLNALTRMDLRIEDLIQKNDAELQALLFPEEILGPTRRMPDFEKLRKELNRPGVTKQLLWREYIQECEQLGEAAFKRSQFFHYFREDDEQNKATLHIVRKPGMSLEVDWSGDTLPYTDSTSGKLCAAHIFVAVLSYSGYTYVEAFPDEKLSSWITGHVHAFEFFGGVAKELIPDNCKTAVIENSKNGIILNETYRELSEHYRTIVMPARVKKPRDKSSVESGVGCVQRLILAPLRDNNFLSLEDANRTLRNALDAFNSKDFQKKEGSRRSWYEDDEKELLIPLPPSRFTMAEWKIAKVQYNSHVQVLKHMYSVPYLFSPHNSTFAF